MLKTAPTWSLFKDGVFFSLVLIAGALARDLVFALVLGAAMGSRAFLLLAGAPGLRWRCSRRPSC